MRREAAGFKDVFDRSDKIRGLVYFCLDVIVVSTQTIFCGVRQFWH